jgi:hypothetical protein
LGLPRAVPCSNRAKLSAAECLNEAPCETKLALEVGYLVLDVFLKLNIEEYFDMNHTKFNKKNVEKN